MTPTEAAAVLRGVNGKDSVYVRVEAQMMGAEALELLAYADTGDCPEITRGNGGWFRYTPFGDVVRHETLLDALRQAKKSTVKNAAK